MKTDHPLRVMVVDDNEMVRMALGVFLNTRPELLWVGEAADGEETIHRVPQVRPDVILMDRKLPGMDGIAVARLIKEQFSAIRVLLLSGDFSPEDQERALWAGVSQCLHKSLSNDDLARAILATHPR